MHTRLYAWMHGCIYGRYTGIYTQCIRTYTQSCQTVRNARRVRPYRKIARAYIRKCTECYTDQGGLAGILEFLPFRKIFPPKQQEYRYIYLSKNQDIGTVMLHFFNFSYQNSLYVYTFRFLRTRAGKKAFFLYRAAVFLCLHFYNKTTINIYKM